jgi:hypothetical protein
MSSGALVNHAMGVSVDQTHTSDVSVGDGSMTIGVQAVRRRNKKIKNELSFSIS